MDTKILIIGACGQIGTELTHKLRMIYGNENVIASDIRKLNNDIVNEGIFEVVNALDYNQIEHLIEKYVNLQKPIEAFQKSGYFYELFNENLFYDTEACA